MYLVEDKPLPAVLDKMLGKPIDVLRIEPHAVKRHVERMFTFLAAVEYLLEKERRLPDTPRAPYSYQPISPIYRIVGISLDFQRRLVELVLRQLVYVLQLFSVHAVLQKNFKILFFAPKKNLEVLLRAIISESALLTQVSIGGISQLP